MYLCEVIQAHNTEFEDRIFSASASFSLLLILQQPSIVKLAFFQGAVVARNKMR